MKTRSRRRPAWLRVFYLVEGKYFRRRCLVCSSGFWRIETDYSPSDSFCWAECAAGHSDRLITGFSIDTCEL